MPVSIDDTNEETEVADTIDDECFLRSSCSFVCIQVVTDEHVRAKTDQLPEYEDHDQVVREDDPHHGKHEDRKTAEKAALGLVIRHVSKTEYVNQEAYKGDHRQHRSRYPIEQEAHRYGEVTKAQPINSGANGPSLTGLDRKVTESTDTGSSSDREVRSQCSAAAQETSNQHCREQWREKSGEKYLSGGHDTNGSERSIDPPLQTDDVGIVRR